ncbi:beta-2 adrenergic receptor-like [Diadema antillarum]|uniref:beta-2 adrenergic receptor-like n=1 Tax=Diadema antillarum TaxID=105358 RepID=UPI003A8A09A6
MRDLRGFINNLTILEHAVKAQWIQSSPKIWLQDHGILTVHENSVRVMQEDIIQGNLLPRWVPLNFDVEVNNSTEIRQAPLVEVDNLLAKVTAISDEYAELNVGLKRFKEQDIVTELPTDDTTDISLHVSLPDIIVPNYPFMTMICILIAVITISNCLAIRTIVSSSRLLNQTGFCLINLAIADISNGIFYLPFCVPITLTGKWYSNSFFCLCMAASSIATVIVSIATLSLISVDRYICISRPLHYQRLFSKQRVRWLLLFTWLYGGAVATFSTVIPQFVGFRPDLYSCAIAVTTEENLYYTFILLACGFYAPLCIIFFSSSQIARISWRAQRSIYLQTAAVQTQELDSLRETLRQVKKALRVFVVLVAFMACWGPFAVGMHYMAITRKELPWQLNAAFGFLANFNSAMNPFIYIITNPAFRKVFFKKYCPCLWTPKVAEMPSDREN